MPSNVFTDKSLKPGVQDLHNALGKTFSLWSDIAEYVFKKYPDANDEWAYPGKNFGWNYRIKDARRVIIYMMPGEKFFRVSLVFGSKATDEAMICKISKEIKDLISSAKVYAEGRGFRIDVKNKKTVKEIKKLIDIKLLY
jgi:uncharacterized protein DUF3788